MSSYLYGKEEIVNWIKQNFKETDTCLDVGACDGMWAYYLDGYFYGHIDAVEIYEPNIIKNKLHALYRNVYNKDIRDFEYGWYDLIILGDVIEHMTVEEAQKVIDHAKSRCRDMIIAVPFLLEQVEFDGNEYEKHIQDDLTDGIFHERYPGFEYLWINEEYGYYHLRPTNLEHHKTTADKQTYNILADKIILK